LRENEEEESKKEHGDTTNTPVRGMCDEILWFPKNKEREGNLIFGKMEENITYSLDDALVLT
jgi:hypothetical protein